MLRVNWFPKCMSPCLGTLFAKINKTNDRSECKPTSIKLLKVSREEYLHDFELTTSSWKERKSTDNKGK